MIKAIAYFVFRVLMIAMFTAVFCWGFGLSWSVKVALGTWAAFELVSWCVMPRKVKVKKDE